MRAYLSARTRAAKSILANGFQEPAFLSDRPIRIDSGYGDLVLCLEIPSDLFAAHAEKPMPDDGTVFATVPAADLSGIDRPKVYDHVEYGKPRGKLVRRIKALEKLLEEPSQIDSRSLDEPFVGPAGAILELLRVRQAVELFDEIGWRSLLKYESAVGDPFDETPPEPSPVERELRAEQAEALAAAQADLEWRSTEEVKALLIGQIEEWQRTGLIPSDKEMARQHAEYVSEEEAEAWKSLQYEFPDVLKKG